AGADIEAMAEMSPEEGRAFCRDGHSAMRALEQLPVPVLAAVDGFALGGGLELAVSCDLIYASGRATFGLPEVGLGVIPGFGGTQRLARFVGWQHAKEIVFTGNNFDADRAESIDLVCDVFHPDDFDSCVRDRAETIASRGPRAIREAKRVMNAGRNASLETGLALERGAFSDVFDTEDRVEGMEAFVEGRDPDFSGK
ncbi:MAG: enoyl-CoA hydratase/isomerase family protein, partial [Bradymonadaceae bacterium]